MESEENYLAINQESWNNRVGTHLNSEFYDLAGFLKGKSSLNDIELKLLGDVKGKSILHLQCHFGQDSISLSRLGAEVTGVDLSDKAIESAKQIAKDCDTNTRFICADIYDLPNHLDKEFDIVFSSYGTIGWLPDMYKWAEIVSRFLKQNGKFVFVEFHPFVWMFDDNFEKIAYDYFNTGAIVETENGTYADKSAEIKQDYVMWNHSLSDVVNALISNGIELKAFMEYDYSPYNCFSNCIEIAPKKFRIKHIDKKIPMLYAVEGRLKN